MRLPSRHASTAIGILIMQDIVAVVFLVGFFLNIGISGTPTWTALGTVLLLVGAMPFKAALFFGVLTRFKLRSRTAMSMQTRIGIDKIDRRG